MGNQLHLRFYKYCYYGSLRHCSDFQLTRVFARSLHLCLVVIVYDLCHAHHLPQAGARLDSFAK